MRNTTCFSCNYLSGPESIRDKIIKASGGIRKLRWAGSGRGKRGGIRVIYYYFTEDEQIYMLYAYPKSKKDDPPAGGSIEATETTG